MIDLHTTFHHEGDRFGVNTPTKRQILLSKTTFPAATYGIFETSVEKELLEVEVAKHRMMMRNFCIHKLCRVVADDLLGMTLEAMKAMK